MRLTSVTAKDFLSYEDLSLDLSDVSQVVVVGQNGHGKSALLDAVLWCLYGEGRGSADQMVRHGALSAWVKTSWEVNGHHVVVTRHRSKETKAGESSLHLEVDGQKATRHTIAETQDAVDAVIGLSSGGLTAGPFMIQGHSDTLMRVRPAERKDLLIDLLALERFERYHEAAKVARNEVSLDISHFEKQMEEAEEKLQLREGLDADLEHGRGMLSTAESEVKDRTKDVEGIREEATVAAERARRIEEVEVELRAANADLDEWSRVLTEAEEQLAEQRRRASEPVTVPPLLFTKDIDELISTAKGVTEAAEGSLTLALQDHAGWQRTRADLEQVERTLAIREGKTLCDTCPFVEHIDESRLEMLRGEVHDEPNVDAAREYARSTRQDLTDLEARKVAVVAESERQHEAYRMAVEMKALAGQLTSQTEEGEARARVAIQGANARIARMTAERMRLGESGDIQAITDRLSEATNRLGYASSEVKTWEKSVRDAEYRLAELDELMTWHRRWEGEVATMREQERILDLLVKAWHRDGVPTLILENALPAIEERANEILGRMPGDFAVRLVTQKAKKAGGMAETLDVTVETEGIEREYDLLSGGERFRVDLALRVSLAELLTRRSGSKVETLWLDEPLAALDVQGREAVISSLAAIEDEFQLIVIVSHHDEFNDRFPVRIQVTKDQGVSRAEVMA